MPENNTHSVVILHCITELSIGGAQNALLRLLANLDRQRYQPVVASLFNADGAVAMQIRGLNIPVIDLEMPNKWRLDALWRFYRLLRKLRPAVLHTWMFHANIPGRIIGRIAGVPNIISSERIMGLESKCRLRLNRLTVPLADRVICVSSNVADFARDRIHLPDAKLVVIPNGIDMASFENLPTREEVRAAEALPTDQFILASIGRPRPQKGYDILIDAFGRLAPSYPKAQLLFVGDGPDRPFLQEKANQLGLSERVTFLGDRIDIPRLLPALDIVVLPSRHEGMPNVALEAMAAGLPVVATTVGGIPEVVDRARTGLLVPPENPAELASALCTILENPDLARKMGASGRQRIEENFDIQQTVARTEQLYASLLNP